MRCLIYADGACPGNGGANAKMQGSFAAYIVGEEEIDHEALIKEKPLCHFPYLSFPTPPGTRSTNNFAEACTLRQALAWALKEGLFAEGNHITVCMDSELVICQFSGLYRTRNPALREVYASIYKMFKAYQDKNGVDPEKLFTLTWISGEVMKQSVIGH